ncbi:MAG: TonB family protein [Cyanobacteria bacterium P01_E01_bin.35]
MSTSKFCIQQRQREQQRLKKLLIFGFAGSAVLHGILAYTLPRWSWESPKQVKEPMELILVDQPKPKPKPKIESKPVVEPKPKPKPEPVKAQTPPPPVKPPEPVKTQTPPPKPAPKKVLTTPTPAPSQPIVSVPIRNTAQPPTLSSSFTSPNSSVTSAETSNSPGVPGSVVATNSAPPRPDASNDGEEGISCVSNCEPEYPAALDGVEGRAGVKLTIDPKGNVIGVALASPDTNSQVNRQALLAARQMQFSSPGNEAASVQVKIDFTVEGSEYDRLAREAQEKKEQAEKERQEQETARQQQLELERQARQEQMERERQARQQQQEAQPQSPAETQPASKPLPTLSEQELDEERLRKFQERMENYQ